MTENSRSSEAVDQPPLSHYLPVTFASGEFLLLQADRGKLTALTSQLSISLEEDAL
jgi:hypothetical protein